MACMRDLDGFGAGWCYWLTIAWSSIGYLSRSARLCSLVLSGLRGGTGGDRDPRTWELYLTLHCQHQNDFCIKMDIVIKGA